MRPKVRAQRPAAPTVRWSCNFAPKNDVPQSPHRPDRASLYRLPEGARHGLSGPTNPDIKRFDPLHVLAGLSARKSPRANPETFPADRIDPPEGIPIPGLPHPPAPPEDVAQRCLAPAAERSNRPKGQSVRPADPGCRASPKTCLRPWSRPRRCPQTNPETPSISIVSAVRRNTRRSCGPVRLEPEGSVRPVGSKPRLFAPEG